MIEILVCLLVMSIVVICAAGLLLQTNRLARHSSQFSAAATFAGELADWLRARSGREAPSTATGSAASHPELDLRADDPSTVASTPAECYATACAADDFINFILQDWWRRVRVALPDARAMVCRDADPWSAASAGYQWTCTPPGPGGGPLLIKIGWRTAMSGSESEVRPSLVVPVE